MTPTINPTTAAEAIEALSAFVGTRPFQIEGVKSIPFANRAHREIAISYVDTFALRLDGGWAVLQ